MNTIFKTIILAMFTASTLSSFATRDFTRTIEETFTISNGGNVEIINKYGNVDIRSNDGNEVIFKIEIAVDAKDQDRADDVFDRIDIDFYNTNSHVKAETKISDNDKFWKKLKGWNNSQFEIHYYVNVPRHVFLKLNNKYGNISCQDMDNQMELELKYGNFDIGSVHDLEAVLGYGNGKVNNARDIDLDMKYGKFEINECDEGDITSKYSKISVVNSDRIESTSKYDEYRIGTVSEFRNKGGYDKIDIESVQDATIYSKYTEMVIRSLEKNLTIETGYGSIRVDEVSDQLEEIDIKSSHAGIGIKNPNDIGFRFDIHTKYGDIDIDHGSGDFTDDDNEEWAKGKRKGIGEGIIKIDSRYGNVRIR